MTDDNKTEYVNTEKNADESNPVILGIDHLKTEYVGRPSNQTAGSVNQTEYVGKDSDMKVGTGETRTEYVGKPMHSHDDEMQEEASTELNNEISMPEASAQPVERIDEPEDENDRSIPEVPINESEPNGDNKESEDEEQISYYLPTNTILQKRYRINSVIGEGGFGITYSGWDITLNTPVAIKEYYPSGLVTRSATLGKTTQVVPLSQAKYGNQFRDGIDRVLDEARRTAKFRNTPGIVGIYDFFEANNTAYIVLEYVDGETLDVYCRNNRMDNTTLFNLLVPVMDALQALHNEGIIHRDISPDNIMVDKEGNLRLLDFGAARGFSEESSTTMSIILKKSYAPEEQFRSKGNQGPWTDVYALGASIYELIAGQTPPSSIDRLAEDEIVDIRKIAPSLTKGQADAIMKALAIKAPDRWQSMSEFKSALLWTGSRSYSSPAQSIDNTKRVNHLKQKVVNHKILLVVTIVVILVLCALIIYIKRAETLFTNDREKESASVSSYISDEEAPIEAHLSMISTNRASYYSYIEFTNPTDKDVEVHTKYLYLNGIPVDENRTIGVVPSKKTLVLMEYTNVDALINQNMDNVESFMLQFQMDDDDTIYTIEETGLSILINYFDKDKEKLNNENTVDSVTTTASSSVDVEKNKKDIADNQESSSELSTSEEESDKDIYIPKSYQDGDLILNDYLCVSTTSGKSVWGNYCIVDASIIESNSNGYTIGFKIKTISDYGLLNPKVKLGCLNKEGFEIKEFYLDVSGTPGEMISDTKDRIPKDTVRIVIQP